MITFSRIHDLCNNENRGIRPDYVGDDGPSITQDEISEAIKKMKDRKAPGIDELPKSSNALMPKSS